ncbi:MAG: protein translocase SEC61 complex subunit gamma [Candidatus Nanoarchaeia archaeon]|nr:protein translocase SEC61 complex subunit gamma [Candidatus Nanoarchaeia archaeon]
MAPNKKSKIGNFIKNAKRVLKLTRKPTKEEFTTTLKITALGVLAIGFIGFVIVGIKYLLSHL